MSIGMIIFTFLYILFFPAVLLILSGDILWLKGWIFAIWFIVLCFVTIIHLYRTDPALLAERYRWPGSGNQKRWDKYVVYALVIGFTVWIVIMPLDAKRYGWTEHFPSWIQILGGLLLVLSSIFFYRSYSDNTYASPLVRIQRERNQQVVSTGVYSIVRHPMYLGSLLLFLGTPMLLASFYGLILGLVNVVILAMRIIGEEKMLISELDGYKEYLRKVRYRLIPFIW
ncbi:MAG TPA: isoprenylcysteine carboxylmethyltransferase family protein [Nitrospirota bacterium]|nr:isoprenylcysteine carboxylmethyltransferase family protein [Nitrospirota bacterium]